MKTYSTKFKKKSCEKTATLSLTALISMCILRLLILLQKIFLPIVSCNQTSVLLLVLADVDSN